MQVYNQTKSISLCNRIENRVLKNCKKISDFQIKKADFLYEQNHIYDLIGITSETNFTVDNPIGILGKIKFEESLLTRGFTGALQDALPLEESAFVQDQRSVSVVVFPKYGKRYHTKNCRYVIKEYAGEGYKLEMEKEDAIRKGYSTCFVCGGGIDVL